VDLLSAPIANCSAKPLEKDISTWHANIFVESIGINGITFHFEIKYPNDYPNVAPKVKPFTTIKHQNVFGDYICLDILTMSKETANTPYRGWTPAYTISSLLIQLESFLFEAVETRSSYDINLMKQRASDFRCRMCGHQHTSPKPEISLFGSEEANKGVICPEATTSVESWSFLEEVDNVVLDTLLSFCDEETKVKIGHISLGNSKALDVALARARYKCFYTLKKFGDGVVILGLGAQTDIMDRRSRKTRRKTAQLQRIHGSFDFLSWDAFQQGVRNNIWKDREFDYFIPLYINAEHGKHSLPLAEKCMVDMWTDSKITNKRPTLTPATILETLAKFMNTTVVNMMKTVEDLEAGELQLFDSIKALEGFCSMHHLLLAFAKKYPAITQVATQKVKYFIENPDMRDKEVTPDVGELMISVALSSYTWSDFAPAWLEEAFIRNQRWICAKYPNLLRIEDASSCVRLTQSFNATRTGKRLAMFQRFFISEIASPARLKGNPNKNAILLKEYNLRMGLPEKGMAERLQQHSRKVIGCTNWWDYFALIDFCPPGHARLSAWLRNSLRISEMKEYHSRHLVLRYGQSFITSPDETHQTDKLNCLCAGSLFKLPENCKIIKGGEQPKMVREEKMGIDICFVMDCTGSMSSWIETAKERIEQIINSVSAKAKGTVRFAIVGYRDHDSQGWGDDKWVLKQHDFTRDSSVAKKRLLEFRVGGGGGYEAMCCAMEAAADMSWNRESHQIVVLIGDQPPHGYINDTHFPKGCPCGSDTLRVVHTMQKNGIVVYPVDCGRRCANRETFYHALARITGGYAITLTQSALLPEIVFGACMEEKLMDKLAGIVAPVYDNCLKSHSGGRFEQHCRSVFAELNAKKIKVESCLPPDNYDETIEHQVDCIAYCMDMQQAKKMAESEYFIPINRQTKLCSYMERPVTQEQITKCMKRMQSKMAEMKFLKDGCQYRSSKRFSQTAFKNRWLKFKAERGIQNFTPWNKLTSEQLRAYSKIPDGERLKKLAERSAPMKKATGIPGTLIGQKVEVKMENKWIVVKIVSKQRGGKYRVILPDGFDMMISGDCTWRLIQKKDPWGKKKNAAAISNNSTAAPERPVTEPQKTAPSPQRLSEVPAPVVKKSTQAPTPAPRAETQIPRRVMRKNISIEVPERIANRARNVVQAPPAAISRRDSAESDSGRSISRSMSVEPSPRVALKSTSSPPHTFVLGQIVECKNAKAGKVHQGVVQKLQPLMVKVEGFKLGRWRFVRKKELTTKAVLLADENIYSGPDLKNICPAIKAFKGTNVTILEIVDDFAHVVFPFDGWVKIKSQQQTKSQPQPQPKLIEEVLLAPVTVYSDADDRSAQKGKIGAGMRIKISEYVGDFAHIVYPEEGFIDLNRTVSLSPERETPARKSTSMLPTIECLVGDHTSAKDLAMACDSAVKLLPKKVRIKLVNNRRVGVIAFETHEDAESVLLKGLTIQNWPLLIKWSPLYLQEIAL